MLSFFLHQEPTQLAFTYSNSTIEKTLAKGDKICPKLTIKTTEGLTIVIVILLWKREMEKFL